MSKQDARHEEKRQYQRLRRSMYTPEDRERERLRAREYRSKCKLQLIEQEHTESLGAQPDWPESSTCTSNQNEPHSAPVFGTSELDHDHPILSLVDGSETPLLVDNSLVEARRKRNRERNRRYQRLRRSKYTPKDREHERLRAREYRHRCKSKVVELEPTEFMGMTANQPESSTCTSNQNGSHSVPTSKIFELDHECSMLSLEQGFKAQLISGSSSVDARRERNRQYQRLRRSKYTPKDRERERQRAREYRQRCKLMVGQELTPSLETQSNVPDSPMLTSNQGGPHSTPTSNTFDLDHGRSMLSMNQGLVGSSTPLPRSNFSKDARRERDREYQRLRRSKFTPKDRERERLRAREYRRRCKLKVMGEEYAQSLGACINHHDSSMCIANEDELDHKSSKLNLEEGANALQVEAEHEQYPHFTHEETDSERLRAKDYKRKRTHKNDDLKTPDSEAERERLCCICSRTCLTEGVPLDLSLLTKNSYEFWTNMQRLFGEQVADRRHVVYTICIQCPLCLHSKNNIPRSLQLEFCGTKHDAPRTPPVFKDILQELNPLVTKCFSHGQFLMSLGIPNIFMPVVPRDRLFIRSNDGMKWMLQQQKRKSIALHKMLAPSTSEATIGLLEDPYIPRKLEASIDNNADTNYWKTRALSLEAELINLKDAYARLQIKRWIEADCTEALEKRFNKEHNRLQAVILARDRRIEELEEQLA